MCGSVRLLRGLVDCAIRYPCVLGRTRGKAGKRAYASSRIIQDGRTHADGCAWTLRAYTQGCCMRARPIARGCGGASACACACAWAWAIHAYMHCTALHCTARMHTCVSTQSISLPILRLRNSEQPLVRACNRACKRATAMQMHTRRCGHAASMKSQHAQCHKQTRILTRALARARMSSARKHDADASAHTHLRLHGL
jgi:hypothetical protein